MDEISLIHEKAAVIIQKAYRGMAARKRYGPLINKEQGTLNEETAEFIRYYANKWKNKSMFQILLQYRAAKYQDLFNFSQQVHLYNQNAVNILYQYNTDADFNLIDNKAKVNSWLGEKKPTVLKVPFRLDEIPYYDTSYMCDSDVGTYVEVDEPWDAPFRWRDSIASQSTSSQPTKESKTECNIKLRNLQLHKQVDDKLINTPYTRDPSAIIKPLPAIVESKTPLKVLSPVKSYSPKSPIKVVKSPQKPVAKPYYAPKIPVSSEFTEKTNISTTRPANKDFEFIKPSPVKHRPPPGPVNPITELQKLGKKSGAAEDDAPFNFQGMLRKTNFARESLKRTIDTTNLLKNHQNSIDSSDDSSEKNIIHARSSLKKVSSVELNERKFAGEVAPGIYMEGIVVDL